MNKGTASACRISASATKRSILVFGLALLAAACSSGGGVDSNAPPSNAGGASNSVTAPGFVQFSSSTYTVNESDSAATIIVNRVSGSAGTLTATVRTANGTAIAGQDYSATSATVTFADGDAADKTVTIPITNDGLVEGAETFTVALSSTGGVGAGNTATVTIVDDDFPGALQFGRATYSVGESGGAVEVSVTRSNGSAGAVTVNLATHDGTATAGQDYTTTTQIVSFADGDTAAKLVSIPILSDAIAEGDETFTVVLSSATGGASLGAISTATVTIAGNDQPPPPPAGGQPGTLQLSAATIDVDESSGNAVITVTRVGGSVGKVTAKVISANGSATAGLDYTAVNAVVTFNDGDSSSKFVNVPILNDAIAEPAKSFTVTLSAPTGGATLGTPTASVVQIADNDAPAAPAFALSTDIRHLHLSWGAISTVTAYRLYFNADGISGFTQIGGDLSPATLTYDVDLTVYKFNWQNALYRLEACNAIGCTGSSSIGTFSAMLNAIGYFKASGSSDPDDKFGATVAISADGSTFAVGVPGEDSNATGIGGNPANNGTQDSGAVYVFARTGGAWAQQAYIKASNSAINNAFGSALSIASDGNTLAVGAPGRNTNTGAVYLFARSGTTWSQQTFVTASNAEANDKFGAALALSGNGTTLAVGATGEASNATTIGGSQTDNSAANAGAVYVFLRSGASWPQQAYIKAPNAQASDLFGTAVTLSGDGNTLAVGAIGESSNATTINGDQSDNSAAGAGAVYVFSRVVATWSFSTYLKSGNSEKGDQFGGALSFSSDGNSLAVGASKEDGAAQIVNGARQPDQHGCEINDPANVAACDSGAVYLFVRTAGVWSQQTYFKSSNSNAGDLFGGALSLSADGNTLVVGAINDDSSSTGVGGDQLLTNAKQSGAAYLFTQTAGVWSQKTYIKAPNPNTDDVFGTALAVNADGTALVVGAIGESSAATDIGGNRADNTSANAGAAYLY